MARPPRRVVRMPDWFPADIEAVNILTSPTQVQVGEPEPLVRNEFLQPAIRPPVLQIPAQERIRRMYMPHHPYTNMGSRLEDDYAYLANPTNMGYRLEDDYAYLASLASRTSPSPIVEPQKEEKMTVPMRFEILDVNDSRRLAGPYNDPQETTRQAKRLREIGYKCRIRKMTVDDYTWRERERVRFENGTYRLVPWHWQEWAGGCREERYAHASLKQEGLMAYTLSSENGCRDIQTAIKPGVYLQRFYKHLTTADIQQYVADFDEQFAPKTLEIATTAEEIVNVYANGPHSCMSFNEDEGYSGSVHPATVYAAGDLAVAYFKNSNDRISGRALVWPDKKLHGRVYGDEYRMLHMLQKEGFKKEPTGKSLTGARLQRIPYKKGFILPYIDDVFMAHDDGTNLIIGPPQTTAREKELRAKGLNTRLDATGTNGLSFPHASCCACDGHVEEDFTCSLDGDTYCEACYESITVYCDYFGERVRDYDEIGTTTVYMHRSGRTRTQEWCLAAVEQNAEFCDFTNEYWRCLDMIELHDGTRISPTGYADEGGFFCSVCGSNFLKEEQHEDTTNRVQCVTCAATAAPLGQTTETPEQRV